MKKLKVLSAIYKSIHQHPLARKHPAKAYKQFIFWQLGNLLSTSEKKVSFTDKTVLIAKKGMSGATGNIYMGLHEFEDMGFLLHFLREEDVFLDIGANIGSYTVLASGHIGCATLAFEPIPSTFVSLAKNIEANGIKQKVTAFNVGVGSKKGVLSFTADHDTVNHVLMASAVQDQAAGLEVPVIAIDEELPEHQMPALIKIDVEGFETEVLNGMKRTLLNVKLKGIIIELNGSGARYGFDDNIHIQLLQAGFLPYAYDPFSRQLTLLGTYGKLNSIYLRDLEYVRSHLIAADKIRLFSESF